MIDGTTAELTKPDFKMASTVRSEVKTYQIISPLRSPKLFPFKLNISLIAGEEGQRRLCDISPVKVAECISGVPR